MTKSRPFEENDWQAFAGAWGWPQGSRFPDLEPIIREDGCMTYVGGREAIEVFVCDDDGHTRSWMLDVAFPTRSAAMYFVDSLPTSENDLRSLGFDLIRED